MLFKNCPIEVSGRAAEYLGQLRPTVGCLIQDLALLPIPASHYYYWKAAGDRGPSRRLLDSPM